MPDRWNRTIISRSVVARSTIKLYLTQCRVTGIEPVSRTGHVRILPLNYTLQGILMPDRGIEPSSHDQLSCILPLNYIRRDAGIAYIFNYMIVSNM